MAAGRVLGHTHTCMLGPVFTAQRTVAHVQSADIFSTEHKSVYLLHYEQQKGIDEKSAQSRYLGHCPIIFCANVSVVRRLEMF